MTTAPSPTHQSRHQRAVERRRVTADIRRTAWLSGVALVVIAAASIGLAVVRHSAHDTVENAALAAICVAVLLVLFVLARMTRHIVRQARGLEEQSDGLAQAVDEAELSRRRAEAMVRQKARLAAILDAALSSAPVGFAFFDPELRFLRVNARIAALTGLAAEEHVGRTLREAAPEIADEVEPLLVRTLATRDVTVNISNEWRSGASTTRYLLSNFFPIVTEEGELLGVGATMTDVTDRRRLEMELQQARKMDAMGRLAGGITHDFNNLLTVIGTSAELIELNEDVKHSAREIDEIRAAVERAAGLTRQLLTFSRRQPTSPRIVNPNEVVEGMRDLLRRLLLAGVRIVTQLTADPHAVHIEPGQLEQVIMNLTLNAADAMDNSGTVSITTENVTLPRTGAPADALPGDYVLLSVRDTGHGMDAATMEQIFEPFFTTKEPGRGTGLGLATVYGIVRQAGGYVGVMSRPGAGSTFNVYLPAVV